MAVRVAVFFRWADIHVRVGFRGAQGERRRVFWGRESRVRRREE